jgi:hypothetical protein
VTQLAFKALASFARLFTFAVVLGGLGACGMSSLTSGIGGGWFGSKKATNTEVGSVNQDQLLSAAKTEPSGNLAGIGGETAYGCPRFQVWSRDGYVTIYESGHVGDALAVMHRGEITKTARECAIEPGKVTVKYGFSGRVLLGPRGKAGPITLPVNVFVTDSKRTRVAEGKVVVNSSVAVENPIGYFSAVNTVTFDVPEGARAGEYEVWVGFEQKAPGAG